MLSPKDYHCFQPFAAILIPPMLWGLPAAWPFVLATAACRLELQADCCCLLPSSICWLLPPGAWHHVHAAVWRCGVVLCMSVCVDCLPGSKGSIVCVADCCAGPLFLRWLVLVQAHNDRALAETP